MSTAYTKQLLRAELDLPAYSTLVAAGNRQGIIDLLNTVNPAILIKRADITPTEVLEAIDLRDFNDAAGLTSENVSSPTLAASWFESLTQMGATRLQNDAGTDTKVLGNLKRLVKTGGQGSQSRLTGIATRIGTRAEELFGAFFVVTEQHVADALGIGAP